MAAIHKILFVTDAPHFGGAERYLGDMCMAAMHRGIDAAVYWLKPPSAGPDVFSARYHGAIRVDVAAHPGTAFRVATGFRARLQRQKPDAVVFNAAGRPGYWLLPWIARSAGLPLAWVHHMVDNRDHRRLAPQRLGGRMEGLHLWRVPQACRHHLAGRAATAVITSNEEDRAYVARWHRVPSQRLYVIPPGIDAEQCRPSRERRARQEFMVGTAACLNAGKGVDLLIEAAAILHLRGVPIRVRIAGDGPKREALRQLARQRQLADAVEFLDWVDDLPAFYCDLDVFALCSRTESFGLALTEAMACACPVVATPTAGARRQIEPHNTGCLLASHSAAELAETLAQLYAAPLGRAQMGGRARAAVLRDYTIDRTLARTLEAISLPPYRRTGTVSGTVPWNSPWKALAVENSR